MIAIKPGADVRGLHQKVWDAVYDIEPFFSEYGADLVITSGLDSKHSKTSFHYIGLAADLRTRTLTKKQAMAVANKIRAKLGDEYDVILEKNHIHLEYDPRSSRHAAA